jgi:DNA-binding NtrC family response regulator
MASMAISIDTDRKQHTTTTPGELFTADPLILLVEDDPGTRRFISTILRHATSAQVQEASDPFTALSIAHRNGRPIDLLISDIDLSATRTGVDLARELTASNPSIRVLLISAADCPQFELPRPWRFLSKPFQLSEFLNCVNELCASVKRTKAAGNIAGAESAA